MNCNKIKDTMANELFAENYFTDLDVARHFAEIICLPHHHHHEKLNAHSSSNNLLKMASSANFQDLQKKGLHLRIKFKGFD